MELPNQLPPGKHQNENEEDDDIPQTLFVCNAREAITFKMVYKIQDLEDDEIQRAFKPDLVFQLFGESEAIYGFRNLKVDIYFMANSANCLVDIKHNPIRKCRKGAKPDNILEKLSPWLPENYCVNKEAFRATVLNEDHQKMYGSIIDSFDTYNKNDEFAYSYHITHCSTSESGFAEFHARFESLIVWYIDAASQVDMNDPNWMFFYVYEEREQPNCSDPAYYPVGYCSIYKFFHFPNKVRIRIAQLFIIPPCQRIGVGMKLLSATYKVICQMPNVIDIAVEDPCEAFTRMRDVLDCQLLTQLESFKFPKITSGFTHKMFTEANIHFKLNKRQCRRAYEVLRMTYVLIRVDHSGYRRLYKEIQEYIEAPYKREREAVKRKRVVMPRRLCRDDAFVYNPADSPVDLTKTIDLHFREIKVSAHHLVKRMRRD